MRIFGFPNRWELVCDFAQVNVVSIFSKRRYSKRVIFIIFHWNELEVIISLIIRTKIRAGSNSPTKKNHKKFKVCIFSPFVSNIIQLFCWFWAPVRSLCYDWTFCNLISISSAREKILAQISFAFMKFHDSD